MPSRASSARRSSGDPAGKVGERGGGRAHAVEQPDRPECARAQRRAVDLLVVREELALERRHVDAQRALALARLAFQAQIHDLVKPLVPERRPRIGRRQGLDQGVGSPPGRVLLLARGHVGRAHHAGVGLAAGADVHAAVRRVAHAAVRRTADACAARPAGGSAASRRFSVIGGASTIFPGFRRPSGSKSGLDLAHRRVELGAEHAAVELAAGEAIPVLAGVDAAVAHHQLEDLLAPRRAWCRPAGARAGPRTAGCADSRPSSDRRSPPAGRAGRAPPRTPRRTPAAARAAPRCPRRTPAAAGRRGWPPSAGPDSPCAPSTRAARSAARTARSVW